MMFPLPPGEAAVIAEIFRLFPGTREVTGGGDDVRYVEGPDRRELAVSAAPPPVTSQASLFDHPPRRAA